MTDTSDARPSDRPHDRPHDPASDYQSFLAEYQQVLDEGIAKSPMPALIRQLYRFESCLKHRQDKQVYLVSDKRTGGQAILRVMGVDAQSPGKAQRDQEYGILSRLDFDGIPKVYGSFVEGPPENRQSFLLREYFPGRPLDVLLAQGPLDSAAIIAFAQQLCSILGYLHSQNPPVVHRDIKPANIIVRPSGRIGLTDFGIARTYKAESDSDTSYEGTLLYAPPEQFGFSQSTPLSDIYALGIVLLCMATGSPMRQGIDERVSDRRLRAVIERCIAFDPEDRYQSVLEIQESLAKLSARQASSLRKRVVAVAAAAALTLGLGIGGYNLGQSLGLFGGSGLQATQPGGSGNTPGDGSYNASNGDSIGDNNSSGDNGGSFWSSIDRWTETEPEAPGRAPAANSEPVGSASNPAAAQGYLIGDALFDSDKQGNLSGNIINSGYAVEAPDAIYVAIDNQLISMNRQGRYPKLVAEAKSPRALNYYQGFLYFASEAGIHRYDPATGQVRVLSTRIAWQLYISDDKLYFTDSLDRLNLYAIDLSSESVADLVMEGSSFYQNLEGGYIYFTPTGDGSEIMSRRLNGGTGASVTTMADSAGSSWLSVFDGHFYFYSSKSNPALVACDSNGRNSRTLATGSCSHLVACPFGVFYIAPATGQLSVFRFSDGRHQTVIAAGVSDFCLAGDWVIYRTRGDQPELRMAHFDGASDTEVLLPSGHYDAEAQF